MTLTLLVKGPLMCKKSSNTVFLVLALMLVLTWGTVLQGEIPDAVGLWTFGGDATDSGTGGNDGELVGRCKFYHWCLGTDR